MNDFIRSLFDNINFLEFYDSHESYFVECEYFNEKEYEKANDSKSEATNEAHMSGNIKKSIEESFKELINNNITYDFNRNDADIFLLADCLDKLTKQHARFVKATSLGTAGAKSIDSLRPHGNIGILSELIVAIFNSAAHSIFGSPPTNEVDKSTEFNSKIMQHIFHTLPSIQKWYNNEIDNISNEYRELKKICHLDELNTVFLFFFLGKEHSSLARDESNVTKEKMFIFLLESVRNICCFNLCNISSSYDIFFDIVGQYAPTPDRGSHGSTQDSGLQSQNYKKDNPAIDILCILTQILIDVITYSLLGLVFCHKTQFFDRVKCIIQHFTEDFLQINDLLASGRSKNKDLRLRLEHVFKISRYMFHGFNIRIADRIFTLEEYLVDIGTKRKYIEDNISFLIKKYLIGDDATHNFDRFLLTPSSQYSILFIAEFLKDLKNIYLGSVLPRVKTPFCKYHDGIMKTVSSINRYKLEVSFRKFMNSYSQIYGKKSDYAKILCFIADSLDYVISILATDIEFKNLSENVIQHFLYAFISILGFSSRITELLNQIQTKNIMVFLSTLRKHLNQVNHNLKVLMDSLKQNSNIDAVTMINSIVWFAKTFSSLISFLMSSLPIFLKRKLSSVEMPYYEEIKLYMKSSVNIYFLFQKVLNIYHIQSNKNSYANWWNHVHFMNFTEFASIDCFPVRFIATGISEKLCTSDQSILYSALHLLEPCWKKGSLKNIVLELNMHNVLVYNEFQYILFYFYLCGHEKGFNGLNMIIYNFVNPENNYTLEFSDSLFPSIEVLTNYEHTVTSVRSDSQIKSYVYRPIEIPFVESQQMFDITKTLSCNILEPEKYSIQPLELYVKSVSIDKRKSQIAYPELTIRYIMSKNQL